MAKKNKATQRKYGKQIRRELRAKLLQEIAIRTSRERYEEMNEQFRAGDPEIVADVLETKERVRLAVERGDVEERIYLGLVQNIEDGKPFCSPI